MNLAGTESASSERPRDSANFDPAGVDFEDLPDRHATVCKPRVTLSIGLFLAFRTGCSQSVVMHAYNEIKRLALRFRGGSLHSCLQGSEGVSVLEGSR